jgi:hypothetical protein
LFTCPGKASGRLRRSPRIGRTPLHHKHKPVSAKVQSARGPREETAGGIPAIPRPVQPPPPPRDPGEVPRRTAAAGCGLRAREVGGGKGKSGAANRGQGGVKS